MYIVYYKVMQMDIVIKNITSKRDIKFISELVKRLGLKSAPLSIEKKEEVAIGYAIRKGLKSGFVSEKKVRQTLYKIQGK